MANHMHCIPMICSVALLATVQSGEGVSLASEPAARITYPAAARGPVVDDYNGTQVADPYRWLEELDSPATRAWVTAESRLTNQRLAALPLRAQFRERIGQLFSYERYGIPFRDGKRLFYTHNSGRQDQAVLYVQDSPSAPPRVLLDPNLLSKDGSQVVVGYVASRDGSLLAYGVSESGSDWVEWRLRDVEKGVDLPDVLRFTKYYRPVFSRDGKGLYYSAFPAPTPGSELSAQDLGNAVYYHALGSSAADRKLLELTGHRDWQYKVALSEDGRWSVVATGEGEVGDKSVENIYLLDLSQPAAAVRTIVEGYRAAYEYLGSDARKLYFLTTAGASNGRVVSLDPFDVHTAMTTVVPEGEPIALSEEGESVTLIHHQFIIVTVQGAHNHAAVYTLGGRKVRDIDLPGKGTILGFEGRPGDARTFYSFSNMVTPTTVYEYDAVTGRSRLFRRLKLAFDPGQYQETELKYPARDGTLIPLQLVRRRGIAPGPHPLVLSGYGGFGIVNLPTFSPARLAWLERGGVYAIANIRGGGEFGEKWHRAANRHRKQVVFDDFIDAARWLIRERYTVTPRLAIMGASNGGLLAGACVTQHPELYGAVVAEVGVMDMLRFPLFGQGAGWMGEYGDPHDPWDFKALYAYSPLHNVRAGTHYPATLIVTGDHDTRVMPGHSFKFAAAMQAAQAGTQPILLYVEGSSGHGGGSNVSQGITQGSDIYAFLADRLGVH
jgi:prolyl oligopeptidase